ncbi:MAG TPA: PAS domain S-box protein [Candidatus Hydrogenedentes bacterium]|nr:PAS domain S-box protein [Candidatus Hydrogenedentota bacterium]
MGSPDRGHLPSASKGLRAEEALRLTQFAIDHASDSVFWLSSDGRFSYVNDAACRSLGYSRDELLHMHVFDIDPNFPVERWPAHWSELKAKHSFTFESVHRPRDGRAYPVEITVNFLAYNGQEYNCAFARDITDRQHAAEALRRSEERLRAAQAVAHIGNWELDVATKRIWASEEAARIYGFDPASEPQPLRVVRAKVHPEEVHTVDDALTSLLRNGAQYDITYRIVRGDKKDVRIVHSLAQVIRNADGAPSTVIGTIQDVTENRRLEEQFHHAQRMESIGRLAGGVAHDFNNILSVILSDACMLLEDLADDTSASEMVLEIQQAAQRAKGLTQQLLAFSRKQVLEAKVLDLNGIVADMQKMLRRLIGEDIRLVTQLGANVGHVRADPAQIQQILMNLAVNARDAMPGVGTLTIETAAAELDEAYAQRHGSVEVGSYAMLTVSDTGHGMSEKTAEHIFEPFFTTKAQGKGTGLGLSTVYGIVKQHGGYIWVYTEPGKGTTFRIYLPHVDEPAGVETTVEPQTVSGGNETVLLVEDDPSVRRMARRILDKAGYHVLDAANGLEALRVFEAEGKAIELVVTDVIMPEMNGRELYERIAATRPDIRVLYMSGYTDNVIAHHGILNEGTFFLQKPFSARALTAKVREVLDA